MTTHKYVKEIEKQLKSWLNIAKRVLTYTSAGINISRLATFDI